MYPSLDCDHARTDMLLAPSRVRANVERQSSAGVTMPLVQVDGIDDRISYMSCRRTPVGGCIRGH